MKRESLHYAVLPYETALVIAILTNIAYALTAGLFCSYLANACTTILGFTFRLSDIGRLFIPGIRTVAEHVQGIRGEFLISMLSIITLGTLISGLISIITIKDIKRYNAYHIRRRDEQFRIATSRFSLKFYNNSLSIWFLFTTLSLYFFAIGRNFVNSDNAINFTNLAFFCIIGPFLFPGLCNIVTLLVAKRELSRVGYNKNNGRPTDNPTLSRRPAGGEGEFGPPSS